ncbi:MAG: photosystem reaction center subunit [Frankiales bacterium]|nr:photosystem reaction center subunit [Frankiales bacterium]
MTSISNLAQIAGKTMVGADGHKIGKVVDVYESTAADTGTFVTVKTGLFGGHASFVPLRDASADGDAIVVPYGKELVRGAPRVGHDEELTAHEEERLYRHYSLVGDAGQVAASTGTPSVGQDTSGPETDSAMTRSQEHLVVGTQKVESGRARLRKRVVTETETRTVPVSHEELRIQREPIVGGQALPGARLAEQETEVVLEKEVPVVAKQTVPVERVRIGKQAVTEQQTVREQVRKENVEYDGDGSAGHAR